MYVNEFAARDGMLRVHMIGHGSEPKKSDAFLLEYNGTFIMIDGGLENCDASLRYLLEIRRTLLSGHEELIDDPTCRLKLDIMVSHFHSDHVGALYTMVFPSPYLEIGKLYMPPHCRLDERYGLCGDVKYRPLLERAMTAYQPQTETVSYGFGVESSFSLSMFSGDPTAPVVTVCPAWINSADEGRIARMIETRFQGDEQNANIATMVMNNNSTWIHVRHGNRTFLFTGDTVKKNKPIGYEMVEEMTEAYASVLGQVDVVKYIHHGYKRNAAADAMMSFQPRYVVVTAEIATGNEVIREKYPDSDVKLINCGVQTYVFESDGEDLTVTPEV